MQSLRAPLTAEKATEGLMASSHGEEGPPTSSTAASATTVAMPAKLLMASGHEDCERLKDLLKKEDASTMVVVMASSKNREDTKPAPRIIDARLLMAARKGDYEALKNLLVGHQVRKNDLQMEPHFIIHMPEGTSSTEETEESSDHQSPKAASGKTHLLFREFLKP